jgi:predicted nucleotidyltransferase
VAFVKLSGVSTEDQIEQVVALVRGVLGAELVGVYLFGSAVLGGLKPTSDLDFLVVSRLPTTPDERRHLVERLLFLSLRPRYLEVTIVVESEIRPWRYPPQMDFQYGDWLRPQLERGEIPPPAPNPDLTALITMTLLADRPLVGPPAAEVFDPVPHEDLLRAGVDELEHILAELDSDTRNMLLTLARIWSTAKTGELRSKDAAADWALSHLPRQHRPVLERARDGYRAGDYGTWDDVDVRAAADYVVGEIRRSSPRRGADAPR